MPAAAPTPRALQSLHAAVALLRQARPADAARQLRLVVTAEPDVVDARRLLGLALAESGDFGGAEIHLRQALVLDPAHRPAVVPLAETLIAAGKADEALAFLASWVGDGADLPILTVQAQALKAAGRLDEAIVVNQRAVDATPASAIAEHNLAASLGDAEAYAESVAAARRAMAKGGDAPQTWLVLARSLLGQSRLDEAETAYREALRRAPLGHEAHTELAQLVWMRTEDVALAQADLNAALARAPGSAELILQKARLLEYAGDLPAAYGVLSDALAGRDDSGLHNLAAQISSHFDPPAALRHAERARALRPANDVIVATLSQAHLALGQGDAAAEVAEGLYARQPLNQHATALLALAWRLTGDARYGDLYDYEAMVRGWRLDTPNGWPSLDAYLGDLAEALNRKHAFRTHPIGQSLRHGSQANVNLTHSDEPAIRAFFQAVDGPIRRHLAWLGEGGDRLRVRSLGGYRFNGVWSVRLRPDGFHADHVHPMGWLSSACYIALPEAVERGREGWIKFGQPGVPTAPDLGPEHFVKPEPGLLVLFPSYMWHGTVPFSGDQPRLTVAFDLLPAPADTAP